MVGKDHLLRRLGRACLYLFALFAVVCAVGISLIRASLPYLNQYHEQVTDWLIGDQPISLQVDSIDAGWYKFGPVLIVNTVDVKFDGERAYNFDVERIKISIDFWNSILQRELQLNNLILDGVDFKLPLSDITELNDVSSNRASDPVLSRLQDIFFRQLGNFELTNSNLRVLTPSGKEKRIHIRELSWLNRGDRHQGEGWAYINDDTEDNNLRILIDLTDDAGDSQRFSGQIYAQAENVNLASWLERVLLRRDALKQGTVSFESWIDIASNKVRSVLLKLEPSQFAWQNGKSQQRFNIWGGRIQWLNTERGWQVDTRDLAFVSNGIIWPQLDVQIREQDDALMLALNQLELAKLLPIVALSRYVDESEVAALATLFPHGLVKDLKVKVPLQDWQSLAYQARLEGLQLSAWQNIPGFNNLDIDLSGTLNGGRVSLQMTDSVLDYDAQFESNISINKLSSDLRWYNYGPGDRKSADCEIEACSSGIEIIADNFMLDTPELVLNTQFLLDIPKQKPAFLSLAGDVALRDISKAHLYYPTEFMGEELIDYLKAALRSGHASSGKLLWYGEFSDYPYQNHDGIFQALVNASDAEFKFDSEWPSLTELKLDLLFQNEDLFMTSSSAKLGQVQVEKLDIALPELGDVKDLTIFAEFNGSGYAAEKVLDQGPLTSISDTLDTIKVGGEVNGELKLVIPFSEEETQINGLIALQDNRVHIVPMDMDLTHVSGVFRFADDILTSGPLSAELWGQELAIDFATLNTAENYQLNINLGGQWDTKSLLELHYPQYSDYVSGQTDWKGLLSLVFPENGFKYAFDLDTDLKNILIDLPVPLQKQSDQQWPTTLTLLGNDKQTNISLNSGDMIHFSGLVNYETGHEELIQSLVQIGDPDTSLRTDAANAVIVDLESLDLLDWSQWYAGLPQSEAGNDPVAVPLSSVQVKIKQSMLNTQPIEDLSVTATKGYQNWGVALNSSQFNGTVTLPDSGTPTIDFDYLYLPELFSAVNSDSPSETSDSQLPDTLQTSTPEPLSWQQFPSLNVNCNACIIGDINLGKLFASLVNTGNELKLNSLDIDMDHTQISASGSWFTNADNHPETRVAGKLKSKSIEQFIGQLGMVSPLAKTPGSLDFDLSWLDGAYRFDQDTLTGHAAFRGNDGRILNVSDKGARFLSLFSLQSLTKKLSLDFSDIFSDGLPYYSVNGSIDITDGVVKNDDLILDSSSGKVKGKGYIDLAAEKINYDLSFYPDVTSSIPVLTAFAVTPPTAIAVFALSKILEPVVDVVTEIKFKVTGDLDDPVFEEVQRNQKEIVVPAEMIESARQTQSATAESASKAESSSKAESPSKAESTSKGESSPAGQDPQPVSQNVPEVSHSPEKDVN